MGRIFLIIGPGKPIIQPISTLLVGYILGRGCFFTLSHSASGKIPKFHRSSASVNRRRSSTFSRISGFRLPHNPNLRRITVARDGLFGVAEVGDLRQIRAEDVLFPSLSGTVKPRLEGSMPPIGTTNSCNIMDNSKKGQGRLFGKHLCCREKKGAREAIGRPSSSAGLAERLPEVLLIRVLSVRQTTKEKVARSSNTKKEEGDWARRKERSI